MSDRIFLLSPANCGGRRAALLQSPASKAEAAVRLHAGTAVPLGEIFAFVSGLYFRGKLAYAARFARRPASLPSRPMDPESVPGAWVITPNAGLCLTSMPMTLELLAGFASASIALDSPAYTEPLIAHAHALAEAIGPRCEVVLLGSIASGKYVDLLLPIFGTRLLFPSAFVGRGDMSRGGLMLRAAAAGAELDYEPVAGATRRGSRPPRLDPAGRVSGRPAPPAPAADGGR